MDSRSKNLYAAIEIYAASFLCSPRSMLYYVNDSRSLLSKNNIHCFRYSIQEFNGQVTFKGPAFPDRTAPGMSMGGGLWPVRYVNYCGGLFEDFDEDEVQIKRVAYA